MRALTLFALLSVAQAAPRAIVELPDTAANREALRALDAGLDGPSQGVLRFDLPAAELPRVQALPGFRLVTDDAASLKPARDGRGLGYPTAEELDASLWARAELHPDLVRALELGRSVRGRPITAAVLTDRPWEQEPDEPTLRILGTHHGDEWSSLIVTTALIDRLLERRDEPAIAALLADWQLWFVPLVNPDGYEAFTRRNDRGVDLNRNYSERWEPNASAGDAPFSEPETRAVRGLAELRPAAWSVSLHSGETNLGWPWNWTLDPHEDGSLMEGAALAYGTAQPGFWFTQGSDWYITVGDTNDWSLATYGGHDFTLEVSLLKAPPEEELPELLTFHVDPLVDFLVAAAGASIRGRLVAPEQRVHGWVASELRSPMLVDPETGAFGFPAPAGPQVVQYGGEPIPVEAPTAGLHLPLPSAEPALTLAEGLQQWADQPRTLRVCGPELGDLALLRGVDEILVDTAFDGGCATATPPPLSPGELHLAVGDAVLPLALQIAESPPPWDPVLALTAPPHRGAPWTLTLDGGPPGAEVRLIGPSGQRVRPEHLPGGPTDAPRVRFFGGDLAPGVWAVRIVGGQQAFVDPALLVVDGTVQLAPEPEPEPTPTPTPTPAPPEDDGVACSCSSPNAVAFLAPLLPMGYARRRRDPCAAC